MAKSGPVRTIRLPLHKFCSSLPAAALISGGILLSASAAPTALQLGAVSHGSPAVVVPDVALTTPAPGQPDNPPLAPAPPTSQANPPVSMLPAGTSPDSSALVTLDSTGIPVRALEGYRKAATLTNAADPACKIDWALVAAIGRVESNHARFGGNQLDNSGVAQPGIIGIPLDGSNGTARITDTDHGRLDRDTVYDRAVGPMQFIPSTWSFAGVDANGDGVKNPQDITDAATATAVYLCSGPGDLTRPADLRGAIWRYNASDSYVRMVTSIAAAYRQGVTALPAYDLAPAAPAPSTAVVPGTAPAPAVSNSVAPGIVPGTTVPPTTVPPTTEPPVTVPPTTEPPVTVPPTTVPPTTEPPVTVPPTTTEPPVTVPPTTVPPTTVPPTTEPPVTVPPTTVPPTTDPATIAP